MPVTTINPPGLLTPNGYAHVSVATGSKLIHVAGQAAHDPDGNIVGPGDLTAQTERALDNVAIALAAAQATFDDIVNLTFYVPNWDESKFPALAEGIRAAAATLGINPIKPSALIGVASLGRPEWLIEISATAVTT
ncbi:RidA family protein [Nocardia anaemiae]|uniref:RidA family protein n=1 Tax=Nocardia anaemiae TaxID=263910 RepID=UPI0007A3ABDE|nr:RidA family protein [Nocardia anaemiae]